MPARGKTRRDRAGSKADKSLEVGLGGVLRAASAEALRDADFEALVEDGVGVLLWRRLGIVEGVTVNGLRPDCSRAAGTGQSSNYSGQGERAVRSTPCEGGRRCECECSRGLKPERLRLRTEVVWAVRGDGAAIGPLPCACWERSWARPDLRRPSRAASAE